MCIFSEYVTQEKTSFENVTMKCSICFSLKTSFLKWSPDIDGAVSEYTKAGMFMAESEVHRNLIHKKDIQGFTLAFK